MGATGSKRFLAATKLGKHMRAVPYGNAQLACADKLRIGFGDGGRNDHSIDVVGHMLGIVADENRMPAATRSSV